MPANRSMNVKLFFLDIFLDPFFKTVIHCTVTVF
jgi:hypothetical protein